MGLKPSTQSIAERLALGNPRSLGETNAVVRELLSKALADPAPIAELVRCFKSPDPLVQSRAANALRKIAAARPGSLDAHSRQILNAARTSSALHARWNLTLLLGMVTLNGPVRAAAVDLLLDGLQSGSALERTFAMQALANLATDNAPLRARLIPILEQLTATGTAAMRARGKKLLRALRHPSGNNLSTRPS